MKIDQNESFLIENFEETKFFLEKCHKSHIIFWPKAAIRNILIKIWKIFPKKFVHVGAHCVLGEHYYL